jgi:hypothetical protein
VLVQLWQVAPERPQKLSDALKQLPLVLQHPSGQLAAVHFGPHTPEEHPCPVAHRWQVTPFRPQKPSLGGEKQDPNSSQHPVGQLAASHFGLHWPCEHNCALLHERQAFPPSPHLLWLPPTRQMPSSSQQPSEQLVASQKWGQPAPRRTAVAASSTGMSLDG